MLNGIYRNPTTIHFGSGVEAGIGQEIGKFTKKILLLYGEKSIKKNGLYEKILSSLKTAEISFLELDGVKPNPLASLVYRGIEICRKEKIDFILAVGGGSVIDTAKAIGIGTPYEGDFFDFFLKKQTPQVSLKIGVILTLPGTGSESNDITVISHDETNKKYDCSSPVMFPIFSFLNPEISMSAPQILTSCGIVDSISHVLERYFSNTSYVDCSDQICEGLIRTLMKYGALVQSEPNNYDYRAEIMWAAKLAHDNTAGFGRKQDWASHRISHEIAARHDVAHGAALSVVFPAWMSHVYKENEKIFLQFSERIFGIKEKQASSIELAIRNYKSFLTSLGMPLTLREIGFKTKNSFEEIALGCVSVMPSKTIGNFKRLGQQDIVAILDSCF